MWLELTKQGIKMETREIADALFDIVKDGGHIRHFFIERMVNKELDRHEFVRGQESGLFLPSFDDTCRMTLKFAAEYSKRGITGMCLQDNLDRMFNQVLNVLHAIGHEGVHDGFLKMQWQQMTSSSVSELRSKYPELWKAVEEPIKAR